MNLDVSRIYGCLRSERCSKRTHSIIFHNKSSQHRKTKIVVCRVACLGDKGIKKNNEGQNIKGTMTREGEHKGYSWTWYIW